MSPTVFPSARRAMLTMVTLLTVLSLSAQTGHGTIPIEMLNQDGAEYRTYSIDTLESYPVGPGVVYTRFDITNGSSSRHCYVYEVDLTNPYIRVEETHAATLGQTEHITTTHQRLDAPGHRSIGAVNCNFWETKNTDGLLGVACQGQVRNGKIGASITPDWGIGLAAYYQALGLAETCGISEEDKKQELGFLMIDTQGRAWINQYAWNSGIRIGEATHPLREANRNRYNPEDNEIVLFNSDLGTRATRRADDSNHPISGLYEVVMTMTDDWAVNSEMHGVITSTNTTGGTLIADNQVVLQGRGTGKTFLEQAAVGDTVAFAIGIYDALTEEYPQIEQLSAGNGLVMRNGRLLFRNWAESDYNHRNYPRTGFGVSADHSRLWMMVMEKPGMFTSEMCSILRHFGAADAMGADGGGSAQFDLMGKILNPTTEGSPRAVSNAIFLFATSPDDDVPASLLFHDGASGILRLPSYASYTPAIRAYNQYGVLFSNDYADFQLSCEPASLGTISDDGRTFTASPLGGDGLLIATAGGAQVAKAVHVDAGEVRIAYDSLICDLEPCPILLYSVAGDMLLPVDPAMATWQSADEQVCTVDEQGNLHGVSNGRTTVYGTLGNETDSLIVHVEIAPADIVLLPLNTDTVLNFSSARGPFAEIGLNHRLFGRPAKVVISVYSDVDIKSVTVTTHCATQSRHTVSADFYYVYGGPDETHAITIRPEQFTDELTPASYPFVLEKVRCNLTSVQTGTDYRFALIDMLCYYDTWQDIEQALPDIPADHRPYKCVINGQVYILRGNAVYDMQGIQVR